jgi:hypothetical protein
MKRWFVGLTLGIACVHGVYAQQVVRTPQNQISVREWMLPDTLDVVPMVLPYNLLQIERKQFGVPPLDSNLSYIRIWQMPVEHVIEFRANGWEQWLLDGRVHLSNGQAFNWRYGRIVWGDGAIYPGSYRDARTLSFPLPHR